MFSCKSYLTLSNPMDYPTQSSLSFTISLSLLRYMSVELVMPSNHLILCCPLHLLPSVYPSITVFPSESALCIRWPKCWSFSFNIRPSSDHSGVISFRMDWFNFLAHKYQQIPKQYELSSNIYYPKTALLCSSCEF